MRAKPAAGQTDRGEAPVAEPAGDEVRPRRHVSKKRRRAEATRQAEVPVVQEAPHELAAQDVRTPSPQPPEHARVEALHAKAEVIAVDAGHRALGEKGRVAVGGLELDDHRGRGRGGVARGAPRRA